MFVASAPPGIGVASQKLTVTCCPMPTGEGATLQNEIVGIVTAPCTVVNASPIANIITIEIKMAVVFPSINFFILLFSPLFCEVDFSRYAF
jgi:hypothetical protein